MNYEMFKEQVMESLKEKEIGTGTIHSLEVRKNNGVLLDGVTIAGDESHTWPTIYLNDYYRQYEEGAPIEKVLCQIWDTFHMFRCQGTVDTGFFSDFEQAKKLVCYKLVNFRKNKELLDDIPFIPFLDLAIVFFIYMDHEVFGQSTIMIYHSHMEMWGVTTEELFCIAEKNYNHLMGWEFKNMQEVIKELMANNMKSAMGEIPEVEDGDFDKMICEYVSDFDSDFNAEEDVPMYVLTNEMKFFGAVSMIQENILEYVYRILERDYYIIPSSVHEVIIVPKDDGSEKKVLSEMVEDINQTQLEPEEVLSDFIYYYEGMTHELSIM